MVLNTEWAQVEVIDLINDGSGLAFGIIGGRSTGVVVKTILPGGVADRDGRLQSGDHILQIGEVNLRGLGSEQVASVLRQCGIHVRMVVARPVEPTTVDYRALGSHAPIVPTKILGDPVELDRHLIENGLSLPPSDIPSNLSDSYIYTNRESDFQLHDIAGLVDVVSNPTSHVEKNGIPVLPKVQSIPDQDLPETDIFTVELKKDDLGLGITVAGYVCEKEEISGIFVKSISKGGAADISKKIQINDRIIEVNNRSLVGHTNHQAVEILKNTGDVVTIKFERYLRGPKYEQLQLAIKANELRPPSPPSPSFTSLPKIPISQMTDAVTIDPEGDSRTSVDFDSAELFAENEEVKDQEEIFFDTRTSCPSREKLYSKWREKFPDEDVEIIIAEITKENSVGLGISLEGTVDVEDGKEVRPHHYIRNILPDGPIGLDGLLRPGDELLEANSIPLLGLNYLEVVSILKQLPNFVTITCARYPVPTRLVIDPSQHKEAFYQRKILAESLQTLLPNERIIKAKSETSIGSPSTSSDIVPKNSDGGGRSKSLEIISGLPMWKDENVTVELVKGDHGLGFSILDYQDPLNPNETVIVIRSLVPGGMAERDGRLIPGDRLIEVNGILLEHATLDKAVQVLKGAPKGKVKIVVAKPFTSNDSTSYASQDTEEDRTCLEEFQECLEEYKECLEVMHICIEDDASFNVSPCTSQFEDFIRNADAHKLGFNNSVDSDASFKSTNNGCAIEPNHAKLSSNISDKDGYETCIDESFSDDNTKIEAVKEETEKFKKMVEHFRDINDDTPTNSTLNLRFNSPVSLIDPVLNTTIDHNSSIENVKLGGNKNSKLYNNLKALENKENTMSVSNPCIPTKKEENVKTFSSTTNLSSSTKDSSSELNNDTDDLKSYYSPEESNPDEFFLIKYPVNRKSKMNLRTTESNVLEKLVEIENKFIYRKCLKEYYNDINECLVLSEKQEMDDEDIFKDIRLPWKSKSSPDIMETSFVTLPYDPGPEMYDQNRRKSEFTRGNLVFERNLENEIMTVKSRTLDNDYATMKTQHINDMLKKHWGSTHQVTVFREPNTCLGISIVGGKVDLNAKENLNDAVLGIFIKNVVPNSPAGKSGHFKTGDRIIEVGGINVEQKSHEEAVNIIRNAKNPIVFKIQSLMPWIENGGLIKSNDCQSPFPSPASTNVPTTFSEDLSRNVTPASLCNEDSEVADIIDQSTSSLTPDYSDQNRKDVPSAPSTVPFSDQSDEDSEDEDDVRLSEGRTTSAGGMQIDRASAANVKRTKAEVAADPETEDVFGYTANKIKKKYANLGHSIVMVQLERSSHGLGLSLAGHKDRNCMAVFVCGMNPKGAAFKTGEIQVGDEILEVNGTVLHGRCHLNASAIIKGLSGPVFKVLILRRKSAIDDIAVKPITQFPVSLAEEASEEQFSANYPNVRTVAIKKGNQSLGIMIIEGKHAEVGQGIFISDIQEGSAAEKAGLEVGEMILAVNKDSLIGSDYDSAANLLKRTEGLVNLIVSNPSKKPTESLQANGGSNVELNAKGALKTSAPPSRAATPIPEVIADPLTCPITPGNEVTIEILTDNKGLGVFFVGGKDTPIPNAILLLEVFPGGMADKDGRLKTGDQIIDVNGISLKDVTYTAALQALRTTLPKMKMIVYRPEKVEFTAVEVDLFKKPGKGLGLSVIANKSGKGGYVADLINGGIAETDGRITRGDLVVSVSGQNVESCTGEEIGAILKTVAGKVSLKLNRLKPANR